MYQQLINTDQLSKNDIILNRKLVVNKLKKERGALIPSQEKENHLVVQLEFHTWADSCGTYKYLYHEPGSVSVKRAELPSAGLGF